MREAVYEGMAQHEALHWWFVGRRRVLHHALKSLALPQDARILEVGAGTGGNIPLLKQFGEVTAAEPNPQARAWISTKSGVTALDCSLPDTACLGEKQFDLIAMLDVLEHVADAPGALVALERHLQPGGRFLVTVPAYPFLWSKHDESVHHFRRYTRLSLSATVREAGLHTVYMRYFNTVLFPAVAATRLVLRIVGAEAINEDRVPPLWLNRTLAALFSAERHFVLSFPMPFGVSLLAVLKAHRL